MSAKKRFSSDELIDPGVQPKDQEELIRIINRLSRENEQQRGIIHYQREEIQTLTRHLMDREKQADSQTPNILTEEESLLPLLESIEEEESPPRKGSKLHRLLSDAFLNKNSKYYGWVNGFLVGLILFSVLGVTLESVPSLMDRWGAFFHWSEIIVVSLFTVEYLINIFVAENKLGYIFSLWGLIDLIAILPSYFHLMDLRAVKLARTLRIVRFLRTIRMLRILKLARNASDQYQQSAKQRVHTLKLDLQIYATALLSVIIICSTLIYYAERNAPGTSFSSIPAAMWWCVVTITTVGYGDMSPSTLGGKLVAAMTMIMGLALFGILMNVIGKAMMASLFGSTKLD